MLVVATTGCATIPERAYYPDPAHPETRALAGALWNAAKAASDDAAEYSFAMIRSNHVGAHTVEDATFYFTQGLAHELLGHVGQRRAVALSLGAGLTVLGVVVPGASLID